MAAADAFLKPYLTSPTTLPITEPLKAKPTPGKTIVYVACQLPQCTELSTGIQDAAKTVGWNAKIIAFDSSQPATQLAGMQQALDMTPAPDYVVISGLPEAVWGSKIPAFKAAGIPLIAMAMGPVTINKTVIANLIDEADSQLQGKIVANWVISDSQGAAKVLQQDVPDYPTIGAVGKGMRDAFASTCPGCTVTELDITPAQLGSGGTVPAIVSALQRDPSIQYVAASNAALIGGLPAALKAAGLTTIKIVGGTSDGPALQTLSNGTGSAFTANNLLYVGWLAVDTALRNAASQTVQPNGGGQPQMLLLPANVASSGADDNFPIGYQDAFKKMWQVG